MRRKVVSAPFDTDDLDRVLTTEARELMLDLVLRWASLDGAVSQLYASLLDRDDETHADEISDMKMSVKLRTIELTLRKGAPALSRTIAKLKKQAERYGKLRDTIAHCHCAGMRKSAPGIIVFLRYRRHASGGLIVDAIPIEHIDEAKRFAEHLRGVVSTLDEAVRASLTEAQAAGG